VTGASFQHPIKGQVVMDYAVQFVDDTSQYVNELGLSLDTTTHEQDYNYEMMITTASNNAQLWADYLWTSGGKLNLFKCVYYAFKPYVNSKKNSHHIQCYQQKCSI